LTDTLKDERMADKLIKGYEWSRDFFQRTTGKARLSTVESMAAGALAGSATVLLTNPIWVVNTRMTARENEAKDGLPVQAGDQKKVVPPGTIATFAKIIQEDGFLRLFAGVLPALVLVINPILQYTIFEQLKQYVEKRRKVSAWDSFLIGALGKLAATTITYPYITVKSRAHVAAKGGEKIGMTATLKKIYKEEGVGGLYGGELIPRSTRPPDVGSEMLTEFLLRYWTQGHPVGHHRCLLVLLQGCPLRHDRQGPYPPLSQVEWCAYGQHVKSRNYHVNMMRSAFIK
jgi:hypothetical protein